MKMLLVGLASLMLVSGCASGALGKLVTPNSVLIAQIGFDVAVGAYCGPDTVMGKAKALAIKTVAQEMLAIDTGSSVPLAALQAALQAKLAAINLNNPGEQQAANEMILIVNQTVGNLVTKPPTSTATTPTVAPTATVAIATVLQQIVNATAAYGV